LFNFGRDEGISEPLKLGRLDTGGGRRWVGLGLVLSDRWSLGVDGLVLVADDPLLEAASPKHLQQIVVRLHTAVSFDPPFSLSFPSI